MSTNPEDIPTPRSDEACKGTHDNWYVTADFSRQLERELASMRECLSHEIERKYWWIANCEAMAQERMMLRQAGSALASELSGVSGVEVHEKSLSEWNRAMAETDVVRAMNEGLDAARKGAS